MKPTDKTSKNSLGKPQDYPGLLTEIKERIRSAQYEALKAVNKELVGLYWDIGRMIVERQNVEGWGKAVVETARRRFADGVSRRGRFLGLQPLADEGLFRGVHRTRKLAPLVREIGWTHNLAILERCKDPLEREFSIRMTRKFGWSKNVLIHQIDNQSYEKSLLGQTNFDQALTPELRAQAKLAVKDEYTFDFLELGEEHIERKLERALITRIEDFLRAMGGMFAFMGSQYRIEVDGKEFYIDLLLFHRRLRCLVAIELKVGEFLPEFVGKMQFYKLDPILDACVATYNADLDEDGQVDFKGKAKAFVRTYGFLASILPYSNADWKKLAIFLNFLIPKLPAPKEEDLSRGILETIDMDSYRVEVKTSLKIGLSDHTELFKQFCDNPGFKKWLSDLVFGVTYQV